ncbi:amidohydrolase [Desulfoplanes sp.]
MECPRRSEMALYGAMAKKYPEILRTGKWHIDPAAYPSDSLTRIEPPLEYDADARADLVVKNALLSSGEETKLQDIAVSGNTITRVGSAEIIAKVTDDDTLVIDASGGAVLPGFVDSHLHLAVAMERLRACDVEEVQTAEGFKQKIRAFAKNNPDLAVINVFGLHYFDGPIIPAENCRQVLDKLVDDRPLLVHAHDLHTAWGNTRALEEAGVLHPMPPYPHLIKELGLEAKIVKDADNIPTGEFHEPEVYHFLAGPLQARHPLPVDQQLADLKEVCNRLAGLGITGVHRMGLAQPTEDIAFLLLLLELDQRDELPIRVNTSVSAVADDTMLSDVLLAYGARAILQQARKKEITAAQMHDRLVVLLQDSSSARLDHILRATGKDALGTPHPHSETIVRAAQHIRKMNHSLNVAPHTGRDNPHTPYDMPEFLDSHSKVRCETIKIFMDGVVEKDTAYRLDTPPTPGIPEFGQEELDVLLAFADRLGLQVAAHSIGDGSVKSMLDAIAGARTANKKLDDSRGHKIPHRIEHIEMCRQEDLPRFGTQQVITSMQPLHERPPQTLWHELVPKNKWDTAFAWQEALHDGGTLVFGSDWPIVSCDVRAGIHHAITRKPWYNGARDQSVDLEQALNAYTSGAAIAEYAQNIKGKIRPGMLADMVVLSGKLDDLACSPHALDIQKTICDGKVVYGNQG